MYQTVLLKKKDEHGNRIEAKKYVLKTDVTDTPGTDEPPKAIRARQGKDVDAYYVGRAMYQGNWYLVKSDLHNPYKAMKKGKFKDKHYDFTGDTNNTRSLAAFESYARSSEEIKELIPYLGGKKLACFCENSNTCHAGILVNMWKEWNNKKKGSVKQVKKKVMVKTFPYTIPSPNMKKKNWCLNMEDEPIVKIIYDENEEDEEDEYTIDFKEDGIPTLEYEKESTILRVSQRQHQNLLSKVNMNNDRIKYLRLAHVIKRASIKQYLNSRVTIAFLKLVELLEHAKYSIFALKPSKEHTVKGRRVKNTTGKLCHFDNACSPGTWLYALKCWSQNNDMEFISYASSLVDEKTSLKNVYNRPEQLIIPHSDGSYSNTQKSGDGDVTNIKVIDAWKGLNVQLYTSDLGIDIQGDFDNQEELHIIPYIGQFLAGCAMTCDGGMFILKHYSHYTVEMAKFLTLAITCFDRYEIVKPITSKAMNSETYFIGYEFDSNNGNIDVLRNTLVTREFPDIQINRELLLKLKELTINQTTAIQKVLDNYNNRKKVYFNKELNEFFTKYPYLRAPQRKRKVTNNIVVTSKPTQREKSWADMEEEEEEKEKDVSLVKIKNSWADMEEEEEEKLSSLVNEKIKVSIRPKSRPRLRRIKF